MSARPLLKLLLVLLIVIHAVDSWQFVDADLAGGGWVVPVWTVAMAGCLASWWAVSRGRRRFVAPTIVVCVVLGLWVLALDSTLKTFGLKSFALSLAVACWCWLDRNSPPPLSEDARDLVQSGDDASQRARRFEMAVAPHGKGWVSGVAGANVADSVDTFGIELAQAGVAGEHYVGRALERFVHDHGGLVVHGVRFSPGSSSKADVDHALLLDDHTLILVDAKLWRYGTYAWSGDKVIRDGHDFAGGEVHIADAHRKWQEATGAVQQTLICLAMQDSSRYKIRGNALHGPVRLVTLEGLSRELTTALRRRNPNTVPGSALADVVLANRL